MLDEEVALCDHSPTLVHAVECRSTLLPAIVSTSSSEIFSYVGCRVTRIDMAGSSLGMGIKQTVLLLLLLLMLLPLLF